MPEDKTLTYAKYIKLIYDAKELLEFADKNFHLWNKTQYALIKKTDVWEQYVDFFHPLVRNISSQLTNATIKNCLFFKIPIGHEVAPHIDRSRNTALIIPLSDYHEPIYFWDSIREDAKRVEVFEYIQPMIVNLKQPHSVPVVKNNDRISLQFTIEEKLEDLNL